jgi:hypothetical protein
VDVRPCRKLLDTGAGQKRRIGHSVRSAATILREGQITDAGATMLHMAYGESKKLADEFLRRRAMTATVWRPAAKQ